jgi:hypothetical protein
MLTPLSDDGVRYVLCMGRHTPDGSAYSVLIGRDMRMFQLQVFGIESFFYGSVFDGELVHDKISGEFHYLVFDTVMIKGSSVRRGGLERRTLHLSVSFPDATPENIESKLRIAKAGKIVSMEPGLAFRKKRYYNRSYCDTYFPRANGVILMPVDCPVRSGTHRKMFRWMYEPTVDVEVEVRTSVKGEVKLTVLCALGRSHRQRERVCDTHPFVDIKTSFRNRALSYHYRTRKSWFVVKAKVQKKYSRGLARLVLEFFKILPDRQRGNSARTIRDVLQEAMDPITHEEVALSLKGF